MRRRFRADLLHDEIGGAMEIALAYGVAVCAIALSLGR